MEQMPMNPQQEAKASKALNLAERMVAVEEEARRAAAASAAGTEGALPTIEGDEVDDMLAGFGEHNDAPPKDERPS